MLPIRTDGVKPINAPHAPSIEFDTHPGRATSPSLSLGFNG